MFQKDADTIFGGITIVCGIVGTLAGGLILDLVTATISNAFKVGSCFHIYMETLHFSVVLILNKIVT